MFRALSENLPAGMLWTRKDENNYIILHMKYPSYSYSRQQLCPIPPCTIWSSILRPNNIQNEWPQMVNDCCQINSHNRCWHTFDETIRFISCVIAYSIWEIILFCKNTTLSSSVDRISLKPKQHPQIVGRVT